MLRNGNVKLGRGGKIWNFNMPRDTCRHKTKFCDTYCYAKRGHFPCPNVQKLMKTNYEESTQKNFVTVLKAQITLLKHTNKIEAVRLHSCGDFYSQAYFNSWNKIAKSFPDMVFLAYTRNYDIDFSKRVKNFIIFYSVDKTTEKFNKTIKLRATVVEPGEVENRHMALDVKNTARVCNSKCYQCKYCYKGIGNVSFVRRTR